MTHFVLKERYRKALSDGAIEELIFRKIMRWNESGELELVGDSFIQRDTICDARSEIYVEVIDYLNECAKTRYRANVSATQRLINARIKEGYTLDDFKAVIHSRCAEWGQDEKMRMYLRPATLFCATKFEGYLNQAERMPQKNKEETYVKQGEVILYDVQMDW